MDQHRFFNACMALMNIDMHELVEAGIIKRGNVDNGGTSWKRFNDEPLIFLAKLDDVKRDALWGLLEARQRVKDPKPDLCAQLRATRPILVGLIEQEYNIETWGLKDRLAARG